MADNFAAAMMIFGIIAAFAIVLGCDTNPFSGRHFTTLARRGFEWYCSWKIWEVLD